ncbi:MAG: DUF2167 domain-containing protein [Bacteroidales bacterium]|nr:DUF2167 domain-containing protein [Bacteroidales bacterium]
MKKFLSFIAVALLTTATYADEWDDLTDEEKEYIIYVQTDSIQGINQSFHIGVANATVEDLGEYTFLNNEEANHLLADYWDNEEEDNMIGCIIPKTDIYYNVPYAFFIYSDKSGYISDDDAKDVDYDDLMDGWKKDMKERESEIEEKGLMKRELLGWAEKPYYDEQTKTLHWAKKLKFEGSDDNTINYDIYILGKDGYIKLEAVGTEDQLAELKECTKHIISHVKYDEGYRYEDFDEATDNVAGWTVGGLVAGKMLAKAGFFAKFWKVIVLALGAIGGVIAKIFKGKKKEE